MTSNLTEKLNELEINWNKWIFDSDPIIELFYTIRGIVEDQQDALIYLEQIIKLISNIDTGCSKEELEKQIIFIQDAVFDYNKKYGNK